MFRRIVSFFVLAGFITATGAPLIFLKSIAWTGMFIHQSRTAAFKTALAKTFDGKHACNLCKKITKIVKAENKGLKQSPSQFTKCDLAPVDPVSILIAHACSRRKTVQGRFVFFEHQKPFVPPPEILS